jgi:ubiquinone/menaquinone biosynthesis C-methylase UbiE
LGCGLGQVSHLLRGAGLDVTSFEYRDDAPDAEVTVERYPDVRAYISSDPRRLPYADASFPAVLSCGVLEHVLDPDASLDELARVLQPGGTLYVYKLPNRFSYLERIAKRAGLYYHGAEPHELLYTPRTAKWRWSSVASLSSPRRSTTASTPRSTGISVSPLKTVSTRSRGGAGLRRRTARCTSTIARALDTRAAQALGAARRSHAPPRRA